jgi:hypothetical protein
LGESGGTEVTVDYEGRPPPFVGMLLYRCVQLTTIGIGWYRIWRVDAENGRHRIEDAYDAKRKGDAYIPEGYAFNWRLPGEELPDGQHCCLPDRLRRNWKKGEEFWRLSLTEAKWIQRASEDNMSESDPCTAYRLHIPSDSLTQATSNITLSSDLYCSCNGPTVENVANNQRFLFCTGCKKERK